MRTDLRADVVGVRAPGAPRLVAGVDVVDVHRFEQLLARRGAALLDHVFSPGELDECAGRTERLASRLAAKEATAKALGTGIGPVAWRDVEVRRGPADTPVLVLAGGAHSLARALGLGDWAVSLSHDAGYAVAVVVALHGGALHGGALHGGALHGGALHGGALHGGAPHGGAPHGGALHGRGASRGGARP